MPTSTTRPTPPSHTQLASMREKILAWFDSNKRELPMRAPGTSPWGTLVGEVMSQQTPMPRVQPIWQRWMELWPTPQDLAAASPARVLVEWERLGYPSRALRLRECAIAIAKRPGGRVPADYEELCSLPGIGPYTASALMSFQFHARIAVLDTNIRRVLVRTVLGCERPSSSAPSKQERILADSLLPVEGAECARWNVAIMEFGALHCVQRSPACDSCPLVSSCRWFLAGKPASERRGRAQAWAGTDRQARGRVIALLRSLHRSPDEAGAEDASPSVSRAQALEAAALPGADADQAPRVLASLITDGLVVIQDENRIALPSS